MKNSLIDNYIDKLILDIEELRKHKKTIKKISKILYSSKNVALCGNGGSSSTASHFTNDLVKMCKINAICLSDNIPLVTAISNDISYDDVFKYQLQTNKNIDTLVVFTSSGKSRNIISVVEYALDNNICVIAFLGKDGGSILKYKTINNFIPIHINTDTQHSEDLQVTFIHILTLMNYENI